MAGAVERLAVHLMAAGKEKAEGGSRVQYPFKGTFTVA
jgi:hypothetical protein